MSGRWTHAICVDDWNTKHPDRPASAINQGPDEVCCYCLQPTNSGIYIRSNPDETPCKQETPIHKGE